MMIKVLDSIGSVFETRMQDKNTFIYKLFTSITPIISFTLRVLSWPSSKMIVVYEANKPWEIILQDYNRLMPHENNDVTMAT